LREKDWFQLSINTCFTNKKNVSNTISSYPFVRLCQPLEQVICIRNYATFLCFAVHTTHPNFLTSYRWFSNFFTEIFVSG